MDASLASDQVELKKAIRAILVRQLDPKVSLEEKRLLLEALREYARLLRQSHVRQQVQRAIDFCAHHSGFLQRASVDMAWDSDGNQLCHRMDKGLDAAGIVALGLAILPAMVLGPPLLPLAAAIEGLDVLLLAAAGAGAGAGALAVGVRHQDDEEDDEEEDEEDEASDAH